MTVQSDNVCASAWLDNKVVTVMYSGWDPEETKSVLRTQKDASRKALPCPAACADYNRYMGGVDHGDQLRGYHHLRMKSRKFYKYVANFLFDTAVTNSFILHRRAYPQLKLTIENFRKSLAEDLIGEYCTRRRAGRAGGLVSRQIPFRHFPMRIPPSNQSRKRGRCALCQEQHKRRDTQWYCEECKVWLCYDGTRNTCFIPWHLRNQ